jgi:hypothetical protein
MLPGFGKFETANLGIEVHWVDVLWGVMLLAGTPSIEIDFYKPYRSILRHKLLV